MQLMMVYQEEFCEILWRVLWNFPFLVKVVIFSILKYDFLQKIKTTPQSMFFFTKKRIKTQIVIYSVVRAAPHGRSLSADIDGPCGMAFTDI